MSDFLLSLVIGLIAGVFVMWAAFIATAVTNIRRINKEVRKFKAWEGME